MGAWRGAVVVSGVLLLACAGGDEDSDTSTTGTSDGPGRGASGGSGGGGDSGEVTPAWDGYCVATFTEDHDVLDAFDDPEFTAHEGERYLMADYSEFFGEDTAELLFLTPAGPSSFTLTAPAGSQDFPFTTPCTFGGGVQYYAVFADVTVFETEALESVLCELSAGTVLPRDTSSQAGYAALSFNFTGPTTYSVELNAFSEQCGGQSTGFISVPETQVHANVTTWLVPIVTILGPE